MNLSDRQTRRQIDDAEEGAVPSSSRHRKTQIMLAIQYYTDR